MSLNKYKHLSTYRYVDGCHNCKFRFQDSGGIFCQQDETPTPRQIPNVKDISDMTNEELNILSDEWTIWCKGREVKQYCICDLHELEQRS